MRYKRQITAAQLNLLDSHDTSRFLDICGGEKRRLALAVVFMCCFPGMPCVFYGDELGVSGTDELDFRRAMPWQSGDAELLEFYRDAIALRRNHPALRHGELRFLRAEPGERVLVFERKTDDERLVISINASDEHNALPPFGWEIKIVY